MGVVGLSIMQMSHYRRSRLHYGFILSHPLTRILLTNLATFSRVLPLTRRRSRLGVTICPAPSQVESLMTAEDAGKDLASVQDLMKKHDLVENDIAAHEDRVNDMNQQVSRPNAQERQHPLPHHHIRGC